MSHIITAAQLKSIVPPKVAAAFLGVSKRWIYYQLLNNPNFPRLIKLSVRKTGFAKADLITLATAK
ncbi:MAG: AlpA family phage regulatory protein [Sideroxyarcus sp.]|nr:AlpA family phage regulatory protein [Sideroxyarcus sp.]